MRCCGILLGFSCLSSAASSYPRSSKVESCEEFSSSVRGTAAANTLNATYAPAHSLNISGILNEFPLCRLFGEIHYHANRSVVFELWLPDTSSYNSRFLVVGNGGMAGTILESDMMQGLNDGYAVAGGDSGHRASDNNGGNGEPGVYLPYLHDRDQVTAWIRDSIAYFTPAARELTTTFYRTAPRHSYYQGCSTGGAQGMALAEFHEHLFDGIVAGCPGNWYSHLALSFLWNSQVTKGPGFLPQSALSLITNAVLAECDLIDGVADGVLENPLLCHFDITSLQCPSSTSNSSTCLTSAQMEAAQKICAGPVDTRDNTSVYPGFSFGSETEWLYQEVALADAFSIPILQNMAFDDLSYDESDFNWGTDIDVVNDKVGSLIDANSPNLMFFKESGAKLLMYQSWADPYNAAIWPIHYHKQVEETFNGDIGDWFRLFMIPGGGHCGAASNYPQVPATWHALKAVVQWVETGVPPCEMLGTNPTDESLSHKTSKLCPWPRTAKYQGGSSDDWNSYVCTY
ncbi:Uu.00g083210.m01.CDS01 [Anthostomella pinea]|uniref:Carboxylic ester hydrolase n=1 Tax=Anthostomella pinea TaxID=933095 RepID=A0AAI8VMP3_9PEZI|nr:Uu.00g083210.m01.CDS01 [Anthostomella pinea]